MQNENQISSFDIHQKKEIVHENFMPLDKDKLTIVITSGASCPDSIVDQVIQKVLTLLKVETSIDEVFKNEFERLNQQPN